MPVDDPIDHPQEPYEPYNPPEPEESDIDLLPRTKGMYRLLELYGEQGSGGLGSYRYLFYHRSMLIYPIEVDKIIISQDSISTLINFLSPGAYASMTKVILNRITNHLDIAKIQSRL